MCLLEPQRKLRWSWLPLGDRFEQRKTNLWSNQNFTDEHFAPGQAIGSVDRLKVLW